MTNRVEQEYADLTADINAEIVRLKRDAETLRIRGKALMARVNAVPLHVQLQLHDFVVHEEQWAVKHPWLDLAVKIGGGFVLGVAFALSVSLA